MNQSAIPMDEKFDLSQVTLAILAGGAGQRMGRPKAWLALHDTPILTYLLDRLLWPGPRLLVTTPGLEHPPGWQAFDREVVDELSGRGPLQGVLTALEHSPRPVVVIATVDMLAMTAEPLRWLAGQLQTLRECLGLMLTRKDGGIIRTEPFPLACRSEAAPVVRRRLQQQRSAVHTLAELPEFALVPALPSWPAELWTNLNTPEDFQRYLSPGGS